MGILQTGRNFHLTKCRPSSSPQMYAVPIHTQVPTDLEREEFRMI